MIQSLANFLLRRQQKWNSGQMLSILAHSSLKTQCSYRLKFFVAKNHLRSSSPSNCSLLCSRFARSCSPRPSQRSKYTEGVALRMRICIAVQRLSRKCVQKKNTPVAAFEGKKLRRLDSNSICVLECPFQALRRSFGRLSRL